MANSKSPAPRVSGAGRPPSTTQHSSHHTSPHPPRSSKRYPSLKMAPPSGPDASNSPSSPSLRPAHPALSPRPSQRKSSRGSIGSDRPPTPMSKSSIKDSHSSAHPANPSTLLQEKLQQERRHEIQRSLNRLADEMGAANEPRATPSTPTGSGATDGKRPEFTGDASDSKTKGFSLKEMGQTMSTLHKQNFDLKLELFHRRERQTVLEQKIETMEADHAIAEQLSVELVQELEKRDKAVEEAVHMIVSLEARIELLLREREMTRQVEANQTLLSQLSQSPSTTLINHGATPQAPDTPAPNDKHPLIRVPSFMSERTEDTENLRNVYLDSKTSYLSLTKSDSRAGNNGFVSPNMSILSESSFLSIYGQTTTNDSSSPPDIPYAIQSRLTSNGQRSTSLPVRDYTPNRAQRNEPLVNRDAAQFPVHQGNIQSPLKKLEQVDNSLQAVRQTTPSKTAPSDKDIDSSATERPIKPQILPKVRKGIERPARKIITDDPGEKHQGLPPTPDTMKSSSMNGRGQTSESSLRRNPTANDPTHYPVISRITLDQTDEVEPGHWRFKSPDVAQPPSITAFTGRQEGLDAAVYYENRLSTLRRPRSAHETTISRHKNDWDSCSDADDLCSEASSFDYWMKEGLRPSRGVTMTGQTRILSSQASSSRDPPDLFNFPSDGKSWQSKEIFGALGGSGYLGVGYPRAPALNAPGPPLPASETGSYGSGLAGVSSPRTQGAAPPPAPFRRSGLKARTSAPGTPTTARAPGSHGKHNDCDTSRKRSVSGHVPSSPNPNGWPTASNMRSKSPVPPVQLQTQQPDLSAPKRHYPPHASQTQATPRPRSRGITSLFRRSLGSATPQPSASVPPSVSQSPFAPPSTRRKDASPSTVGFPSWECRNDLMENGASATPPPILRNRGVTGVDMDSGDGENLQGVAVGTSSRVLGGSDSGPSNSTLGSGLSKVMATRDGGAALAPAKDQASEQEHDTAQPTQGQGRRWFNLSRVTTHQKNVSGGT